MNDFCSTSLFNNLDEIMDLHYSGSFEEIKKNIHANPWRWKYISSVLEYVNRISDTTSLLISIYNQTKTTPHKEFLDSIQLDEIDYFQFSIQNFYIRLSTIDDLLLLLCLKLLHLGIKEKDVQERHIFSNEIHGDHTFIRTANRFSTHMKPAKSKRNMIVHRGIFQDSSVQNLIHQNKLSTYSKSLQTQDVSSQFEKTRIGVLGEMTDLINETNKTLVEFGNQSGDFFRSNYYSIKVKE